MSCCTQIQPLQCVTSCEQQIKTGLTATETGEWVFEIEFAGSQVRRKWTFEQGESLNIENVLNEDYTHILKIYTPSGALFNDICYSITVRPAVA